MDKILEKEALEWARRNRKNIIKNVLNKYDENYIWKEAIFLAWAPWAWKTEFIKDILWDGLKNFFVHLDLDELRKMIDWYSWNKADCFQSWAIRIMEHLFDKCLEKGFNLIIDWTFWSMKVVNKNFARLKEKWYNIRVFYIHLNPEDAWLFTLWREFKAERKVPLKKFVSSYIESFNNICKIYEDNKDLKVYLCNKIIIRKNNKITYKIENFIVTSINILNVFRKNFIKYESKFVLYIVLKYLTLKIKLWKLKMKILKK